MTEEFPSQHTNTSERADVEHLKSACLRNTPEASQMRKIINYLTVGAFNDSMPTDEGMRTMLQSLQNGTLDEQAETLISNIKTEGGDTEATRRKQAQYRRALETIRRLSGAEQGAENSSMAEYDPETLETFEKILSDRQTRKLFAYILLSLDLRRTPSNEELAGFQDAIEARDISKALATYTKEALNNSASDFIGSIQGETKRNEYRAARDKIFSILFPTQGQ